MTTCVFKNLHVSDEFNTGVPGSPQSLTVSMTGDCQYPESNSLIRAEWSPPEGKLHTPTHDLTDEYTYNLNVCCFIEG